MYVNRDIKSRYLKPDHRKIPGHEIWTDDGQYYRYLYTLLVRLEVISIKKMVEYFNANT